MSDHAPYRVGIIGGAAACDHPVHELRSVGADGLNAYLQCESCGGVLVVADGVLAAVASPRNADS